MEQFVILLIIGIISLVNWLMQRSAELREQRRLEAERTGIPEENPFQPAKEKAPAKPRPQIDPAKEMRKLMEALGLPTEDAEPPEPVHRELAPTPPLPAYQPPLQKSPAEKRAEKFPLSAQPAQHTAIARALRSRDGARQAVVLREILGPPKAFTL